MFSKTSPEFQSLLLAALALFSCALFPARAALHPPTDDAYAPARRMMMDRDLRGRGIKDRRVLAAMERVPRERFVPEHLRWASYDDKPLPIGHNQTISQPYIVAFMTELLELQPTDRVLEIGTGSGYQTAVLARLAERVSSIEIVPELGERARKTLAALDHGNIEIRIGDGFYGWEERGPFDAILVTAAAAKIPARLAEQLRDGGRLVMPLGDPSRTQRLIRARKTGDRLTIEDFTEVLFVPLRGAVEKPDR